MRLYSWKDPNKNCCNLRENQGEDSVLAFSSYNHVGFHAKIYYTLFKESYTIATVVKQRLASHMWLATLFLWLADGFW